MLHYLLASLAVLVHHQQGLCFLLISFQTMDNLNFEFIPISVVVALAYDFHLMVCQCHHRPHVVHFKHDGQCHQLQCGQAHWGPSNGNLNWMIIIRVAIHRHHLKRSSPRGTYIQMHFHFNQSIVHSPFGFIWINFYSNSRGHSPCRSPLLCPSPDSTEGRTTPKFYISKLCTANTNSSSSHSSSLSAAPSPNSSSAMEIPMDLPNLLSSKVANSVDVNSDLDCCSDVDFDCDSQNKLHADEKFTVQKRDEACEKLKKLFFTRVSTDSTETDCSFKSQPNDGSGSIIDESHQNITDDNIPDDNKSDSMECDSSKKLPSSSDGFCIVQNVVSSTVDIDGIVGVGSQGQQQQQQLQQQQEHCSLDDHKTVDDADVIAKCVPNDDDNDIVCGSVSVANVVIDTSLSIETESIENST